MHTVKCTNCGRSLTTVRPVTAGKIRCPSCGQVFVGTTHPVDVASAPASARPQRPVSAADSSARPERPESPDSAPAPSPAPAPRPVPPPVPGPAPAAPEEPDLAAAVAQAQTAPRTGPPLLRPRRSNKAVYLGILMGFAGLFLIGAVILLANLAGKTRTEMDVNGVMVTKWLTKEEIEQEKKRRAEQPAVIVHQSPAPTPSPRPMPTRQRPEVVVDPRVNPADWGDANRAGADPNNAAAPARPPLPEVTALPEDPKIQAMGFKTIMTTGSEDIGTIAGEVASKYDVPLRELVLTPQIVDPDGRVVCTARPYTCQFVPAGGPQGEGRVRYSVKFRGVEEDKISRVRVSAKATPMESGEVCYHAKVDERLDWKPNSLSVSGTATNLGKKAITGAYVYVEFFTRDWIFVASARGALDDSDAPGGRLTAGHRAPFSAEIKFEEGEAAQNTAMVQARLVGKEE